MNRIRLRWHAFGRTCAMIFNDKKSAEEYAKRVLSRLGWHDWFTDEIKEARREN